MASKGFTATLSEAGVVPDDVTVSQAADELVVMGTAAPPAVTLTVCGAGAAPPGTAVKLSRCVLNVRGAVMTNVTVTGATAAAAREELTLIELV